jgi:hypothetical protein
MSVSRRCEAANTNKGGGTRFPRRFWVLEFGVFLELGVWGLELCQSAIFDHSTHLTLLTI